mmetsp:Transcript_32012/g.96367  ORF Transcript_32012/g.96367 Transcript_32012/m.96367 type:complete len:96 (+) Transcript_32012:996-1283(+)
MLVLVITKIQSNSLQPVSSWTTTLSISIGRLRLVAVADRTTCISSEMVDRMSIAKQELQILERGVLLTLAPAVVTCPKRQPKVVRPLCFLCQSRF